MDSYDVESLIERLTEALDADCLAGIRFETLSLMQEGRTTEEERDNAIRVLIRDGLLDAARRRALI